MNARNNCCRPPRQIQKRRSYKMFRFHFFWQAHILRFIELDNCRKTFYDRRPYRSHTLTDSQVFVGY